MLTLPLVRGSLAPDPNPKPPPVPPPPPVPRPNPPPKPPPKPTPLNVCGLKNEGGATKGRLTPPAGGVETAAGGGASGGNGAAPPGAGLFEAREARPMPLGPAGVGVGAWPSTPIAA